MICAAVIILCAIIGYVTASNGEWGPFALCVIIGIGALIMSSNDQFKAEVNWRNYWSSSGKDRVRMRRKWDAEADAEEERERQKHWKSYDQVQAERGLQKAGNGWTAGNVQQMNTTYPCPVCGAVMNEDHRVEYSSGTVYVTYVCGKCKKKLPVKVK